MRYTVQHMCTGLLTNAFSIILRDWYDFAATISGGPDTNYAMSAVSNSLAVFLGTMDDGVRNAVEEYGPEKLRAGDVLVCNDPYRAGNHVNDVLFIRPVFVGDSIACFLTIRAHQLDMGGIVPAGFSATKRSVYESGVVIGPTLLYRDNQPIKSTFNLIFDNARFCELLLPDIRTIHQNLLLGERLVLESIDRYGLDAYRGAIRHNCDVSAVSMRNGIRSIPDGVYEAEDTVDCDGEDASIEYRIRVRVTKVDDRIEFDFSGTSRQARTSINGTALDAKTAVGVAMKFLVDPTTPFTSGTYRHIDLVLPSGTIVSAAPPDGAVFLYWESSQPVVNAVLKALEPALGPRAVAGDYGSLSIHNANGASKTGTPWVTTAQCGGEHGPWGATQHGDGDSYNVIYLLNNLDPSTEAIEADAPVVIMRKEYITDTGGSGENRGGAAVLKDSLYLDSAEHWSSPLHTKVGSGFGVNGGGRGRAGGVWLYEPEAINPTAGPHGIDDSSYATSSPVAGMLNEQTNAPDPNGAYAYFASQSIWKTSPGSMFRYLTNGGGGWGDPLDRAPERVCEDVRDEYVSVQAAYRDYGVKILGDPITDPEGLTIDEAATAARRAEMRTSRDPAAELDTTAFTAAGMVQAPGSATDLMWILWAISRARAHLATMADDSVSSPGVTQSSSLIDVVHAYLSAEVYSASGDDEMATECVKVGRRKLDAVVKQDRARQ